MKLTIYDVAERAGVSITTVSRVINNTGRVNEKTRKKILKVIKETGYQPNVVAAALMGKRTGTIGLIVPNIANPFHADIVRKVEISAREHGFSLLVCNTDHDHKIEDMYLDVLKQKRVDGIIISTNRAKQPEIYQSLTEEVPSVLVVQDLPEAKIDAVSADDYYGGYLAVSHLTSLGHKKIAFLMGSGERISEKRRLQAYRQVLEDQGIEYDDELVLRSDFSVESGKNAAYELLNNRRDVTAFFTYNELLAIGVYHTVKELGLKIPDDLSVVGVDNTILSTTMDPQLTTVAHPIDEITRKAVDILIRLTKGKDEKKRKISIAPDLIIRDSTKECR